MNFSHCPSLLVEECDGYSPRALKKLFNGKKVSPVLQYDSPDVSEESKEIFLENRSSISISGVQTKVGIIQAGNVLRLTKKSERGTHILKPSVSELPNGIETCANEHLTMQIAAQVFGIETAANALCFFKSGEVAYITRRFDVLPDGSKLKMEDFASISGKTTRDGADSKYQSSYEELGELIRKVVPAWRVEVEKYFSVVIFNYLFSNGDAHLKNFSVVQTPSGDYKLSPAYDLMNTRLHIKDSMFALKKGLFKDRQLSFVTRQDFQEFAERIGCAPLRAKKILDRFLSNETETGVKKLASLSYISAPLRRKYVESFLERSGYLKS